MILLVGQYSTGKTTFIRYLLEQDFPGIRIGPEPTTDRFMAVMGADEEGTIPGNALVVDSKKQFRALSGQVFPFSHHIILKKVGNWDSRASPVSLSTAAYKSIILCLLLREKINRYVLC